jgi:Na+/H+ antiporter NhaD/arsenite permease-like protein
LVKPLWWALLFGGCFGGNITLIGSTANIVALGILEKERKIKISFFRWLKIGLVVGLVTTSIVWLFLIWLPLFH